MTHTGLEQRLQALYRSLDDAGTSRAPNELRDRVLAIPLPADTPASAVLRQRRTMVLLVAALLAALLVGSTVLVGSGSMPMPWQSRPALVAPADIDQCALIDAAIASLGYRGFDTSFRMRFDHGGALESDMRVCAHGYDGGWNNPHLLLIPEPVTLEEAELRLDSIFPPGDDVDRRTADWTSLAPGWWTAPGIDRGSGFESVAVSADPYFFVVTLGSWGSASGGVGAPTAVTLARAVLEELGGPEAGR